MTDAGKKRLTAVTALLVAAGALTYISFGGIEDNLVYFWDVEQLLDHGEKAHGSVIRLGGVVQEGTFDWDEDSLDLNFKMAMDPAPGGVAVPVHTKGAPPQMFREGIGVVVEGTYDGKRFAATRVIVKHSNEYQPPEEGERPQDLYKTLQVDES